MSTTWKNIFINSVLTQVFNSYTLKKDNSWIFSTYLVFRFLVKFRAIIVNHRSNFNSTSSYYICIWSPGNLLGINVSFSLLYFVEARDKKECVKDFLLRICCLQTNESLYSVFTNNMMPSTERIVCWWQHFWLLKKKCG